MGKLLYLKNVVTLKLDTQKCNGCSMCRTVCPHGVFEMNGRKAYILDRDACMECGACELNCPTGAIQVKAGVGCATAIIRGARAGTEPTCGETDTDCCDNQKSCACC